MKNSEIKKNITSRQADCLESELNLNQDSGSDRLEQQKRMVMSRIRSEQEKSQKEAQPKAQPETQQEKHPAADSSRRSKKLSKRWAAVLVAAVVLLLGTVVSAAVQQDIDLQFAQRTGIGNIMESLEGGYVKIGKASRNEGIELTADRAVGDRNTQWVQLNTNLKWEASKRGYYMFDDYTCEVTDKKEKPIDGGTTLESFNNNGKVSFWLSMQDFSKINRSKVSLSLGRLCRYEGEKKTTVSGGNWNLSWQNRYAANAEIRSSMAFVETRFEDGTKTRVLLSKVEITPVSIRAEGWKSPLARGSKGRYCNQELSIDSVILSSGKEISVTSLSTGISNFRFDVYADLQNQKVIDPKEVRYVVICGQKIKL